MVVLAVALPLGGLAIQVGDVALEGRRGPTPARKALTQRGRDVVEPNRSTGRCLGDHDRPARREGEQAGHGDCR
ncbi:MAG: hypothetical protein DMF79_19095 [Acidobacteria bacterium]|nr:MAG: hypothetical protein DMF79_19095 [Acidobacteriota bacterium]